MWLHLPPVNDYSPSVYTARLKKLFGQRLVLIFLVKKTRNESFDWALSIDFYLALSEIK